MLCVSDVTVGCVLIVYQEFNVRVSDVSRSSPAITTVTISTSSSVTSTDTATPRDGGVTGERSQIGLIAGSAAAAAAVVAVVMTTVIILRSRVTRSVTLHASL